MSLLVDVISWACILSGSFFAVVGGIGIVRLPDFYTRLHGGGITDTMGAGLILLGLMFQAGLTLVTGNDFFISLRHQPHILPRASQLGLGACARTVVPKMEKRRLIL